MKNHLIIFAKYPREGEVKTRLAATLGFKKATEFSRVCAEHVFSELRAVKSCTAHIFYGGESDGENMKKWCGGGFEYTAQYGGDLGARMENAFKKVFKNGAKKVVIIGTDAPDISAEIIEDAFKKLDESDVVIGPAFDGGYYLLGMKKIYGELFKNVAWSTDSVFKSTMEIAQQNNLSVAVLKTLQDIDTEDDLKSWLKNSKNHDLVNLVF